MMSILYTLEISMPLMNITESRQEKYKYNVTFNMNNVSFNPDISI